MSRLSGRTLRLLVACASLVTVSAVGATPALAAPVPGQVSEVAATSRSQSVASSFTASHAQLAQVSFVRSGNYCGPGANNWRAWMIPDRFYQADFSAICSRHDRCYSSRSVQSRASCDWYMYQAMTRECARKINDGGTRVRCLGRAKNYYNALRWFAKSRYHGQASRA